MTTCWGSLGSVSSRSETPLAIHEQVVALGIEILDSGDPMEAMRRVEASRRHVCRLG